MGVACGNAGHMSEEIKLDKEQGRRILEAAVSLNDALGAIDVIIPEIDDVEWRESVRVSLGSIIGEIFSGLIIPVVKIYPDLDPGK